MTLEYHIRSGKSKLYIEIGFENLYCAYFRYKCSYFMLKYVFQWELIITCYVNIYSLFVSFECEYSYGQTADDYSASFDNTMWRYHSIIDYSKVVKCSLMSV